MLRFATFSPELKRDGPGLLLRDILSGKDPQVRASVQAIAAVGPDVLVLTGFDHDLDLVALRAFSAALKEAGTELSYLHAPPSNRGLATALDMDLDGRKGGPDDAQGYASFSGQSAMAILSRFPIDPGDARDFSAYLWSDLPDSLIEGSALSPEVRAVRRLSTSGHWEVPVLLPGGSKLRVLAFHATPPVFGGPGDANARRNHDETAFWLHLLDGRLPFAPPPAPFVVAGNTNMDISDSEGRPEALSRLLAHPALQDTRPESRGGHDASLAQGGVNARHRGDPKFDTADFRDDQRPGNLRVSYVLPSADLVVLGSGVFWPPAGDPMADVVQAASRHRIVWVDIRLP